MASRDGRTFGHISGVEVGTNFNSKAALADAGVHKLQQSGIHGDKELGAFSICLSKGYEDNVDRGNIMHVRFLPSRPNTDITFIMFSTYVGSGGQDEDGKQISDQDPDSGVNKAMFLSSETRRPVRVVRGANDDNAYSPRRGFRYDGLYVVDEAKMMDGKKGFQMCTFKLKRIDEEGQKPIPIRRTLTLGKLAKMRKNTRTG
ncbi:SRA-YDG [Suillus fuscotomentosus]|uniref:SRA-YDG n=1 Tax=Suillus fuscotomentosus TaxID=1912939 RepID=A0AAD4E459_9AGAM|nr:SRA-YDG [Suillus fuscotomentosus]KAG1899361.1 SRA-YDG [Suillus fuscotomentosus]